MDRSGGTWTCGSCPLRSTIFTVSYIIAKMAGNAWRNCQVCENRFDAYRRVPVALPACGHTFCRRCLVKIRNLTHAINCPLCRRRHEGPEPEDLPVNRLVMDLLESDAQESDSDNSSSKYSKKSKYPDKRRVSTPKEQMPLGLKIVGYGLAAVAGGIGAVLAASVALTAVGFRSAGIAGGSIAASMMSSAARANGGAIAAGSLVAVLQSAGAAGIGAAATATLAGAGATVGVGVAKAIDV
nr:interferon alpha-inducible protein 27-like protein 2B isoform X1 [Procambarus clarkii]